MNNFALFICGIAVTLLSGMGVLVYTISLGYQDNKKRKPIEADADLGSRDTTTTTTTPPIPTPVKKVSEPDSIVQIPSVS